MAVYHHNSFEHFTLGELLDFYTLALNREYRDTILKASAFGAPKDPDFEDEIKAEDIYYNDP